MGVKIFPRHLVFVASFILNYVCFSNGDVASILYRRETWWKLWCTWNSPLELVKELRLMSRTWFFNGFLQPHAITSCILLTGGVLCHHNEFWVMLYRVCVCGQEIGLSLPLELHLCEGKVNEEKENYERGKELTGKLPIAKRICIVVLLYYQMQPS